MAETIGTITFLKDVHSELENRLDLSNPSLTQEAIDLENFLNNLNKRNDEPYLSIKKIVNQLLNNIVYKGSLSNVVGDRLENEFQAIGLAIASFKSEEIAQELLNESFNLDGAKARWNLGGTGQLNAEIMINNKQGNKQKITDSKEEINKIVKKNQDDFNRLTKQAMVRRYMKTDYTASMIKIKDEYMATEYLERIFNILKRRVSLKSSKDFEASKLGATNPYRMYVSVISACTNLGYEQIYDQYYRMRSCYSSNAQRHSNHKNIITTHLNHIAAVYELIGLGLLDAYGNNDLVDLIVIKDSQSGSFKVFNTNNILNDFLKGKSSLFTFGSKSPFQKRRTRLVVNNI